MARAICLLLLTFAGFIGISRYVKYSEASFTTARQITGSTMQVDAVSNHFSAQHGASSRTDGTPVATGNVNTLKIDLGTVAQATTFGSVVTVSNPTDTPQPATLDLNGVPEIDNVRFASTGTAQTTIPAGGVDQIIIKTSSSTAGSASGTLRLAVGSSSWLYRDWPLTITQAPAAPGNLTATAVSGGAVKLTWDASPTTNIAGYNIYRAGADGVHGKMNSAPVSGTSYTDQTPSDQQWTYEIKAVTANPVLESLASSTASATSDRVPPPLLNVAYNLHGTTATITGSSESGAAITIDDTTDDLTWKLTADSSGSFSQAVTSSRGHGAQRTLAFTVTAADAVGNMSTVTLSGSEAETTDQTQSVQTAIDTTTTTAAQSEPAPATTTTNVTTTTATSQTTSDTTNTDTTTTAAPSGG